MPEQPIPFGNREGSGLPQEAGASPVALNVLTDQLGAVHRRPGLRAKSGMLTTAVSTEAITGIWIANNGVVYAVDSQTPRRIYRVAGSAVNLTQDYPQLFGTARPQFAETEALLVVAGGEQMMKVVFADGSTSVLNDTATPSDPPRATHVVANNSRLVANDADALSFLRFSDQAAGSSYAGHESWLEAGVGTSGFVSADGRPDPVVAVHDNTNEVFAFGTRTLQVYVPDAFSGYAPVATRQVGCGAPYSIIANDQTFVWLDEQGRFVQSDGRQFKVINDPIAGTIDAMTTTNDCFGYRFLDGFADVLVWTFPTEGITLAYQEGVGWSRWAGWNGNWTAFPVTSRQVQTTGNLVGLDDGRIGELSIQTQTDYDTPIRAYTETGFLNHGTDARKACKSVRLGLRRGTTSSSTEPQGWLGWRDRPGVVSGRIPVKFGQHGDTEEVVSFRSLGVYRRRAWFFEFSGTEELILASATEEFEPLGD